jgi:hypothetical protein
MWCAAFATSHYSRVAPANAKLTADLGGSSSLLTFSPVEIKGSVLG